MGKQKQLLFEIVIDFEKIDEQKRFYKNKNALLLVKQINKNFNKSLNKSDLVRRILNEIVMSDYDKIALLKICFSKKSEL
jgi:hypothetical protein